MRIVGIVLSVTILLVDLIDFLIQRYYLNLGHEVNTQMFPLFWLIIRWSEAVSTMVDLSNLVLIVVSCFFVAALIFAKKGSLKKDWPLLTAFFWGILVAEAVDFFIHFEGNSAPLGAGNAISFFLGSAFYQEGEFSYWLPDFSSMGCLCLIVVFLMGFRRNKKGLS